MKPFKMNERNIRTFIGLAGGLLVAQSINAFFGWWPDATTGYGSLLYGLVLFWIAYAKWEKPQ